MDRLTKPNSKYTDFKNHKLQQYEDTGLSPKEVEYLHAAFGKALYENNRLRAELEQYKRALCEVCTDLACDDQCPYQMPDFEPCPECEECPGNLGEIHQNTDRDLKCWERYFLARAKAGDQDG